MRIRIDIKLGNQAMQDNTDVAEALRILADRLERMGGTERLPVVVFDRNGNSVGSCSLLAK